MIATSTFGEISVSMAETSTADSNRNLRLGDVVFAPSSGEIWHDGRRRQLAPQPAALLTLLARRAGAVVPRSDAYRAIWPDDTFVDREHGLNHCVRQLRRALGDDARAPRYIETLPRRGYRLLVPVSETEARPSQPVKATSPQRQAATTRPRIPVRFAAAALLLVVGSLAIGAGLASRSQTGPQPPRWRSHRNRPLPPACRPHWTQATGRRPGITTSADASWPHVKRPRHCGERSTIFGRPSMPTQNSPPLLIARSLATLRREHPEGHWTIDETAALYGVLLSAAGRYEEAEPFLLAGYKAARQGRGPNTLQTRRAARRLVDLYEGWGRPAAAPPYRAAAEPVER